MTKEALVRVRRLLADVDDVIYKDTRQQGLAGGTQDFQYSDDESQLSTIVDEAQGQVTKMLEAFA